MKTNEFQELLNIIFKGVVFVAYPDGTTKPAPESVQKANQRKTELMEKSKENWGRLGKHRHLILYHGTSKKNLEKILKEGIKPRGDKKSNWETGIGTSRNDLVYLTYCYACYYAGEACKEDDDIPVVIKVRINQNKTELFPDEEYIFRASQDKWKDMSDTDKISLYNSLDPKMSRINPNLRDVWKESLKFMGTVCVESVPVHNIIGYAELSFKDAELYEHIDPSVSPENYYSLSAFYIDYLERLNYTPVNK